MKEFTLRELCERCGASRRAVQGYEKYGLLSPCGKTKYGYLLYDKSAVEKAKRIKSLQNYGFSLKEIKLYFESNSDIQKILLKQKLVVLEEKCSLLVSFIEEIKTITKDK